MEIWKSGTAWYQAAWYQAAAWLIRRLPDQNQAAAWLIRRLPDQNQAAAWLIRTPVCEKSTLKSVGVIALKLDGVGPVDKSPSQDQLNHFEQIKINELKIADIWHLTPDTWKLICEMWHLTCDTWHVTHGGGWTISQKFTLLPLQVWDWQCMEDSGHTGLPNQRINELMY